MTTCLAVGCCPAVSKLEWNHLGAEPPPINFKALSALKAHTTSPRYRATVPPPTTLTTPSRARLVVMAQHPSETIDLDRVLQGEAEFPR